MLESFEKRFGCSVKSWSMMCCKHFRRACKFFQRLVIVLVTHLLSPSLNTDFISVDMFYECHSKDLYCLLLGYCKRDGYFMTKYHNKK